MKRIGLWALTLLGIVLIAWGIVSVVAPSVSCRGEAMQPGDVCSYSSRTGTGTDDVQTYEERVAAARAGAPTIIVLGALTTAFGTWVAVRGRGDRDQGEAQGSSDIGPNTSRSSS